jgi:hypothetical protein
MQDSTSSEASLVAEIVALTQINGGVLPQDEPALWAELAIWRNLTPNPDPIPNAKNVLASLDEPWDEDYVDEDGTPSRLAVEALHAAIRKGAGKDLTPGAPEEVEEEEEDDEIAGDGEDISATPTNWSIPTVVDHIRAKRLNLNPDWQRSFVWKPRKQKALIESVLLGLPIPSLLIHRDRETGKMSVIDGRQRLETISRFMHPKEPKGERRLRFRTFGAKQEGWKPGQPLNLAANKYYEDLPEKFRTQFDTQALQVAVLSVSLAHLYQIFKRYNTGSVALNAAEIRNAVFQTSPLHEMMFRLGGEHRDPSKYLGQDEQRTGEDLRYIMQNKQSRYGAYDFIGRFYAFKHEVTGSVAKAIFSFMNKEHKADAQRVETLRQDFIQSFAAVCDWYEHPLTEPKADGAFHAFLATIQMVSTSNGLALIAQGIGNQQTAKVFVRANWKEFAAKVTSEKQNSTNFWKFQKEWVEKVAKAIGA